MHTSPSRQPGKNIRIPGNSKRTPPSLFPSQPSDSTDFRFNFTLTMKSKGMGVECSSSEGCVLDFEWDWVIACAQRVLQPCTFENVSSYLKFARVIVISRRTRSTTFFCIMFRKNYNNYSCTINTRLLPKWPICNFLRKFYIFAIVTYFSILE